MAHILFWNELGEGSSNLWDNYICPGAYARISSMRACFPRQTLGWAQEQEHLRQSSRVTATALANRDQKHEDKLMAADELLPPTATGQLTCPRALTQSSPPTPVACHHLASPDQKIKEWNLIGWLQSSPQRSTHTGKVHLFSKRTMKGKLHHLKIHHDTTEMKTPRYTERYTTGQQQAPK